MSVPLLLADACPRCPPGDFPAVLPATVTADGSSLKADYRHDPCGARWACWWDPQAADWPLNRKEIAA